MSKEFYAGIGRVIVEIKKEEEKKEESGIILGEEKSTKAKILRGEIVYIAMREDDTFFDYVGDIVHFEEYNGRRIDLGDGRELYSVEEDKILCLEIR